MTTHTYRTQLAWQGSTGVGYHGYPRRHRGVAPASPEIELSADPYFGGEAARLNPEQLLVLAASSCQLLSFLAVAAQDGVDVLDYTDEAEATTSTSAHPLAARSRRRALKRLGVMMARRCVPRLMTGVRVLAHVLVRVRPHVSVFGVVVGLDSEGERPAVHRGQRRRGGGEPR